MDLRGPLAPSLRSDGVAARKYQACSLTTRSLSPIENSLFDRKDEHRSSLTGGFDHSETMNTKDLIQLGEEGLVDGY